MAYEAFAGFYDALNDDADYDGLCAEVHSLFTVGGITDGIVVDLGCGTGEFTLRLAAKGYDMIAVDASPQMLAELQNKMWAMPKTPDVLLLCQRLEELDLFGTIRGAVSTFDTFNHMPPDAFEKALQRIALFMEPGGLLVFDMNTAYKHEAVLANKVFTACAKDNPKIECEWENYLKSEEKCTEITVEVRNDDCLLFSELLTEYYYENVELLSIIGRNGFEVVSMCDGETFFPVCVESQRLLIAAKRKAS